MCEQFILTTSFYEKESLENSREVFQNFRKAVLETLDRARDNFFDRVVDANVYYKDPETRADKRAEIEIRLTVIEPLSQATRQANLLVHMSATQARIGIEALDSEQFAEYRDENLPDLYAEEGLELVSA